MTEMGDATRFREFADVIAARWPDRAAKIADVAGGKGYLNAELHRRGYRNVVTFDKRADRWTTRPHYRYGHFNAAVDPDFGLVVGMHPDGGTDEVIAYAAQHRVPFAIVPCCVVPSAYAYDGPRAYEAWLDHLVKLAEREHFNVKRGTLPIAGANRLLVGIPALNQEAQRPE